MEEKIVKEERRRDLAVLMLLTFLSSLPLLYKGINGNIGQDLYFHLNRIEGLAVEMRNGVFPVRISTFWLKGYGYPVSIYYGDLFLYLPALFRLLGISVVSSYKLFVCLINLLTAFSAGLLMRTITRDKRVLYTGCLVYCLCPYRMVDVYIRAAVGEYLALAFLPILVLGLWRVFCTPSGEKKNKGEIFADSLYISLAIAAILQAHILTIVMLLPLLLLFFLVCWKRTFQVRTLVSLLLAGAEALLFSLGFLLPFFQTYGQEKLLIKSRMGKAGVELIQKRGAALAQYFAFFKNPFSRESIHVNKVMQLTPGMVLMGALFLGLAVTMGAVGERPWRKDSEQVKGRSIACCLTVLSLISLLLSSNIFPWDWLTSKSRVWQLLSQIQFPWRYLSLNAVLLSSLLGLLLDMQAKKNPGRTRQLLLAVWIVSLSFSFLFLSQYGEDSHFVYMREGKELDSTSVGRGEYLRLGTDKKKLDGLFKNQGLETMLVHQRLGSHVEVWCKARSHQKSKKAADGMEEEKCWLQLPLTAYTGYKAIDEYGKDLPMEEGENKEIRVMLPDGFQGNVIVEYKAGRLWNLSFYGSSLLGVLALLYLLAERRSYVEREEDCQKKRKMVD